MKNVCFLKKAFVLNHSLDCMKCIRLCENYKCLMNDRINAKIKPCKKTKNKKNRFYRPLGQESCLSIVSISLFLFFPFILGWAGNTSFDLLTQAQEKRCWEGKWETRPLWWCPQFKTSPQLSAKHVFSSRNNSWEQRVTFPLELSNKVNYSLGCPKQVGPLRSRLRIEHNKFRSDCLQPQTLVLGASLPCGVIHPTFMNGTWSANLRVRPAAHLVHPGSWLESLPWHMPSSLWQCASL